MHSARLSVRAAATQDKDPEIEDPDAPWEGQPFTVPGDAEEWEDWGDCGGSLFDTPPLYPGRANMFLLIKQDSRRR